jgi:DNA (cytosine-5)-methyltransferase 1
MKLVHHRLGKLVDNGNRIYIQNRKMAERSQFKPDTYYKYEVNPFKKTVTLHPAKPGEGNKVCKRVLTDGSQKSVVDIRDKSIRTALAGCDYITITIYDNMVKIQGHKNTATVVGPQTRSHEINAIQFFAGSGISSEIAKEAGFKEIAFVEFNPHAKDESQWDRYADLCEQNHSDAISFTIPIEKLSANLLPDANAWLISLPCNDYTALKRDPKMAQNTKHLFLHIVRLFYQIEKHRRPEALFIEQVPGFKTIAGESMEMLLRDEGYFVTSQIINAADYGARSARERYYMVASVYPGYKLPQPTGRVTTPFMTEPWFNLEDIDFKTPETSDSLKHLLKKHKGEKGAVWTIKSIDPSKNAIVGTIPKNYKLSSGLALVRHPEKENCWGTFTTDQLRKLHRIPDRLFLGNSTGLIHECIGQAIECGTVLEIFKSLYTHLMSHRKPAQLALFA